MMSTMRLQYMRVFCLPADAEMMTQVGVTAPGTCVAAVTIGSNCYTTVEAALAAVMAGQTIEIHVNINSLATTSYRRELRYKLTMVPAGTMLPTLTK